MMRRLLPALGLVLLAGVATPGCSTVGFYWQAAAGHTSLMSRRVPIDEVLADPETDEALRTRLTQALAIRQFAVEELGLPDNRSYSSYADLERPYVTWNVFAAPRYSVEPRNWCYPVAGCISYRGYCREEAAKKESQRLADKGFDTYYGGATAYSTLGRFADPVLNTMLRGGEMELAAVLFHELAHQVVYRAGDATFSESFASFVEREGVRRYLEHIERPEAYEGYLARLARQEDVARIMVATRTRLAALYASTDDEEALAAGKAAEFERLREVHRELRDESWGGYTGYDRYFASPLNNANLVSVATYHRLVPAFAALLDEVGGDLPAFYTEVEALADEDDAVVAARLEALLPES